MKTKQTLLQIAERFAGENAEHYIRFELPNESPDREFALIGEDEHASLYRDGDAYLIHTPAGLDTGAWDELPSDYPEAAPLARLEAEPFVVQRIVGASHPLENRPFAGLDWRGM